MLVCTKPDGLVGGGGGGRARAQLRGLELLQAKRNCSPFAVRVCVEFGGFQRCRV